MPRALTVLLGSFAIAVLLTVSSSASATVQRSFVASYGNDANPCSITQPCRGFAAAAARTTAGGEVIVLDSAGYGRVRLFQSISVIAPPGVYAGISVDSGNGVTVDDSGSGATVTLRGLTITAEGGSNGIGVTNVDKLIVDRCVVTGFFGGAGVVVDSANEVSIIGTTVADSDSGVAIDVGARSNPTLISIDDSALLHNFQGVVVSGNVSGEIGGSVLTSNGVASGTGIAVSGGPVELHVANATIRGFDHGVNLTGLSPYASVSISHSELTNNNVAARTEDNGLLAMEGNRLVHNVQVLALLGTGVAFSAGDNYFAFDGSDGPPFTGTGGMK